VTLRFGTDGVRGVANVDLTPELVLALGRAAARVLGASTIAVGRDTRVSGPMLQAALCAGLASEGVSIEDLGVAPTPAVAFAATEAGAVISASHNPFGDNGIKFFAAGGRKLTDDEEAALEGELDRILAEGPPPPTPAVGAFRRADNRALYEAHLRNSIEPPDNRTLRIVVDCANGAASDIAPRVIAGLFGEVFSIHCAPDGLNINEGCGATDPRSLQAAVLELGADVGLAFDGDADRVIAVDASGHVVDGDHVIAICAIDRRDRGLLVDDTVVVTVMANLGFRMAMEDHGIHVVETPVGDRAVLEALDRNGWTLGGEQSGHVIFRDLAPTGDGTLTGIQLLDVVARTGRPLAELAAVMTALPQVLRNVRVDAPGTDIAGRISDDLAAAEAALGARGRVLVRPSGTEPLVRVMVEAPTHDEADEVASQLAAAVARASAS
jgi:phosphoglucosamine mutase